MEQLKREIDIEVRISKQVPIDKEEKVKEYIKLCTSVYVHEKISKLDLQFLKEAMLLVSIGEKDILYFIKCCINIEEYGEATMMLRNLDRIRHEPISPDYKKQFKKLEIILLKNYKIQQAKQLIKRGNQYTEVISRVTGLSKDEVNILKIKMSEKQATILGINKREKVIELLLQGKRQSVIQTKLGMSDFEMEDIAEQAKYRRIQINNKNKYVDLETELKQDSLIRIVALHTKLGRDSESISDILKIDKDTVDKNIQYALNCGLIKSNELQGINLLECQEEVKELQI